MRRLAFLLIVATPLAACSSSSSGPVANASSSIPSPSTSIAAAPQATGSTLDPNAELNLIPYNVGEMTGLPGGWRVEVVRVKRANSSPGLPAPGAGRGYVTVDIRVINDEGPTVRLNAAALFDLYDEGNNAHPVIAEPGRPNGLDGPFPRGTNRLGRLVFVAPAPSKLLMILDGQKLSSQRSVFQIDPPKATPRD